MNKILYVLTMCMAMATSAKAQIPQNMMPNNMPAGMQKMQVVQPAQSPVWVSPAGAREVENRDTVMVDPLAGQFSWTAPVLTIPNAGMARIKYDIRFVELLPKQKVDKAIRRNAVVYERKGLMAPVFVLPTNLVPSHFQEGHTYVARVTATVEGVAGYTTSQLIQNDGQSDLLLFRIKP